MKSVNKVILLGNLTRDPELKQSMGMWRIARSKGLSVIGSI
jgi:single-stranded DNA-binding protein